MVKVNTTQKLEAVAAPENAALSEAQIDAMAKGMGEALSSAKRVNVLLPRLPEEDNVVEVCINGYAMLLPRGQAMELPEPVVDILRTAGLV